jgi:hypothetical protein
MNYDALDGPEKTSIVPLGQTQAQAQARATTARARARTGKGESDLRYIRGRHSRGDGGRRRRQFQVETGRQGTCMGMGCLARLPWVAWRTTRVGGGRRGERRTRRARRSRNGGRMRRENQKGGKRERGPGRGQGVRSGSKPKLGTEPGSYAQRRQARCDVCCVFEFLVGEKPFCREAAGLWDLGPGCCVTEDLPG